MAEGDIGAIIDSLDLKTGLPGTDVLAYDLIHWAGDVYVVAYRDLIAAVNHGRIATITIDSAGNIGAPIDILEFSATHSLDMRLIKISSGVVAVSYTGTAGNGMIKTADIDAAGNIGAVIDNLNYGFITVNVSTNPIIHVGGDTYAIAKRATDNDGWIVTVQIDSAGNIGLALIDTMEFDIADCINPDILHISGDVFAIVYKGTASAGKVVTVSIDAAGNIGAAPIDTLTFDATYGDYPHIIHISGNTYAIVYTRLVIANPRGFIVTVDIDAAGNIGAVIDTQEISVSNQARGPSILHVSGQAYLTVFSGDAGGGGSDFYGSSWPIDPAGNIGANISLLKLANTTIDGSTPDLPLLYVAGQVYAAVYTVDGANTAVLATFTVVTLAGGGGRNLSDQMLKAVMI